MRDMATSSSRLGIASSDSENGSLDTVMDGVDGCFGGGGFDSVGQAGQQRAAYSPETTNVYQALGTGLRMRSSMGRTGQCGD